MLEKPLCDNQAFSFHMYTWFGDNRNKQIEAFAALARKQNMPLWVGEFGENSYDMIRSTVAMYNQCPQINGWAFWTWKKAPNRFPGLTTIKVPEDWQTVITWIASGFARDKPDAATARTGINAFIEALKFENCEYDQRMESALLLRQN